MTQRLSRWVVSILLRRIRIGSLVVVEGGERHVYGSGAPAATVHVRSLRVWPMLLRGSRGLAEAFAQGLWDSPDLVALIRLAARNAQSLDRLRARLAPVRWPLQRAAALPAPRHEAAGPARHLRPLRPGQRALLADARPDAELQFGTFFATCSQLLTADGAMLLQAITIDDRAYQVEKAARSFINTYIFPGGCLPSLEVITRELARRTDMQAAGLDDITPHYVETLRRWRANFAANTSALAELGYNGRFGRIWTLYLAYCEAGFAERRICDIQLLLTKPRSPVAYRERPSSHDRIGPHDLAASA